MANENYGYMFLIILVFATGFYTGKLVQIRVQRDSLLRKYKLGTFEHDNILRLLSTRRMIITVIATLLSIVLLAYDVYRNAHYRDFLYILVLALIIIGIGFVIVPKAISGASGTKGK